MHNTSVSQASSYVLACTNLHQSSGKKKEIIIWGEKRHTTSITYMRVLGAILQLLCISDIIVLFASVSFLPFWEANIRDFYLVSRARNSF